MKTAYAIMTMYGMIERSRSPVIDATSPRAERPRETMRSPTDRRPQQPFTEDSAVEVVHPIEKTHSPPGNTTVPSTLLSVAWQSRCAALDNSPGDVQFFSLNL